MIFHFKSYSGVIANPFKHDFHLSGASQVVNPLNPGAIQRPVVNAHSLAGPVQIRLAARQAIIRVRLRSLEKPDHPVMRRLHPPAIQGFTSPAPGYIPGAALGSRLLITGHNGPPLCERGLRIGGQTPRRVGQSNGQRSHHAAPPSHPFLSSQRGMRKYRGKATAPG